MIRATILGCGSSGGVPRLGGHWGECNPENPRNRRRRCSLLLERTGAQGTTRVLIDTGPDLVPQLLDAGVGMLDGVVWTHPHADHIHGLDDLRQIVHNRRSILPGWADRPTAAAPGMDSASPCALVLISPGLPVCALSRASSRATSVARSSYRRP